jgi:antitoxin component of MazEF toxin-antitoxin module
MQIGSGSMGVTLPPSLLRSMGWLKGDYLGIFQSGGDLVIRNDSRRAAKFHHERTTKRDQRNGVDV